MGEQGHWYTPEGKLLLEVPMTTRPGMRPTDLRDARKLGLLPSVTTILQILDKPTLRNWIINRVILMALKNPRHVLADDPAKSVRDEADQYVEWAQNFGTKVHLGIATGESVDDEVDEIVAGFQEWYKTSGLKRQASEHSFTSRRGYAGTVDELSLYWGEPAIVDYKTQDDELRPYQEHLLQLAGYAVGVEQQHRKRISVIISRTQPGLVKMHIWGEKDPTEVERGDKAWLALWDFWRHIKNFYPGEAEWQQARATRGKVTQAMNRG